MSGGAFWGTPERLDELAAEYVGPLNLTGGTVVADTPVLTTTQTWNNAAVTFTGWQSDVTDTASLAGILLRMRVNSTHVFSINKTGAISMGQTTIIPTSSQIMDFHLEGSHRGRLSWDHGFTAAKLSLGAGMTAPDVYLERDAANVFAQRNGAGAQAFRVYNTYTDGSNYERGYLYWNANVFEIGSEAAGTGTTQNVTLSRGGSPYLTLNGSGISLANHVLFSGDNTYDVGDAGGSKPRTVFVGTKINLASNTPGSPADGDVWFDGTDVCVRVSGVTKKLAWQP